MVTETTGRHALKFEGNTSDYYELFVKNLLLSLLTFFIYRPWAINATRKFMITRLSFAGGRFNWHGTGKELFWGMLKGLVIFGLWYGGFTASMVWAATLDSLWPLAGIIVGFITLSALLIPFAIVGTLRYRLSRTSWANVRFSFHGTTVDLLRIFVPGYLLSVLTLGFYLPFLFVRVFRFYAANIRFGSARFTIEGDGWEYFILFMKAIFFGLLTLGLYLFWNWAESYRFLVNNFYINGRRFDLDLSGGDAIKLLVPNALAVLFTLGLALPWVTMRTMRFITRRISLDGAFQLEEVVLDERVGLAGAAGEGLSESFDVDLAL